MHTVREYLPSDKRQISACIAALQEFERTLESDRYEGGRIANQYFRHLLAEVRRKRGRILVAVSGRKIAGFASFWYEDEPEGCISELKHCAYVSDIVILPQYRRAGLGMKLIQEIERLAAEGNAESIMVNVLARNQLAAEFYRKAGFREYDMTFLKQLRPDSNMTE
ncbi:MAG: GNAT family N-acetyltransferase [Methylococcales bacterium]